MFNGNEELEDGLLHQLIWGTESDDPEVQKCLIGHD